jgi:hypothetical protein
MDELMYGYIDRSNGSKDESMYLWIDGWVHGWMSVGKNGWMVTI